MTEQTKKIRNRRNWLFAIQLSVMLGTVLALLIKTIMGMTPNETDIEAEFGRMGTLITSMGVSLGITAALVIVVGHKVRNTIWMGCVILASYLYGNKGMWIVFALWAIDEYILYPLYRRSAQRVATNKEIDKRCC